LLTVSGSYPRLAQRITGIYPWGRLLRACQRLGVPDGGKTEKRTDDEGEGATERGPKPRLLLPRCYPKRISFILLLWASL